MLVVSPGVKLAYTFGEGFTYGAEVSTIFVFAPRECRNCGLIGTLKSAAGDLTRVWGVVLNFDRVWGGSFNKLRLGGQWTGPGIGFEAGPTLVFGDSGTYFGLGFTPWVGAGFFPFYTYTLVFGRARNLHELGVYGKLPLCPTCEGSDDDFDDWD